MQDEKDYLEDDEKSEVKNSYIETNKPNSVPNLPNPNNYNNSTILYVPGLQGKTIDERRQVLSRLKRAAFTIFKKHHLVELKAIGGGALLNAHSLSIKIRGSCAAACGVDICLIPMTEMTSINGEEKVVRVLRIEAR